MDKISLKATDRTVFGKKVRNLRKDGILPGHVFGNNKPVEHISVDAKEFIKTFKQAGETGLINLKIGEDRAVPVLIREIDKNPRTEGIVHVGFYQVNLKEKVTVPVPIELIGEELESVKMGEHVVLQNLSEVEVEALPGDLIEKIEVNIEVLKQVEDAVTVDQLSYDRTKITVLTPGEEIVVKLAPAVTEEMKALMEEQAAEAAAAQEAAAAESGEGEVPKEGEEAAESGEAIEGEGGEKAAEGDEAKTDEKPEEEKSE